MDLTKMGKLIAKIRKEKGLTQEQLGSKFGVLDKTVSKWERGINAPDISVLDDLSRELGITINELLKGELNNNNIKNESVATNNNSSNNNNNNNKMTLEIVKFYSNIVKHKLIKYMIIILSFVIVLFSIIFTINNYNQHEIYSLRSKSDELRISGYLIFNQSKKIIVINDVRYVNKNNDTELEPVIKNINIKLVSNSTIIYEEISNLESNPVKISEYLNTLNVNLNEKQVMNEKKIQRKELKNLKYVIEYETIYKKRGILSYDIEIEQEFVNNRLFY